jgi:ribose 5-phosphate isomerase B
MAQIVAFANDHAGLALKRQLVDHVRDLGFDILDLGTNSDAAVDYPDYGTQIAQKVAQGDAHVGVAICGSGIGISIAANRVAGARAALCHTPEMARLARAHNNANIVCLGARMMDNEAARACVTTFLHTAYEGGRHDARVKKLG